MSALKRRMLIGSIFGVVYVTVNAGSLSSPAAPVLRIAGIAAFVGLVIALRQVDLEKRGIRASGRFSRGYWVVVVAEVVAILAGWVIVTGPLDAPDAGVAWTSVVVGVHFFGLAAVWKQPFQAWLGGAITVCGVSGLILAALGASTPVVAVVAGVAPGLLLLGAGYWPIIRSSVPRHRTYTGHGSLG